MSELEASAKNPVHHRAALACSWTGGCKHVQVQAVLAFFGGWIVKYARDVVVRSFWIYDLLT
jgi:hypothetical protein